MSAIKIIRATKRENLETAVNAFLEGKTIVGIDYSEDSYGYQAVVAYTETETTEETPAETTPTTEPGENTSSGGGETEPPGETEPTEET